MMYHTANKIMLSRTKKGQQKGFSIIELTVVLAVAGMLIVGALVAGNTVMSNMKSNRYVSDISLIVTAARAWKGMGVSYETLTLGILSDMKRVPDAWGSGTNANPDGGSYSITPGTATEVGQFTIGTTAMEQSTCLNVKAQISSQTAAVPTCVKGVLSAIFK